MAPKLPQALKPFGALIHSVEVLAGTSVPQPFKSHSREDLSTHRLAPHQPTAEQPAVGELHTATALQGFPPENQLADHEKSAVNEHVVYLVMQPIALASKVVVDVRSKMHHYISGVSDFGALSTLLLAQHWGVLVDGHYYHLKRMLDDSLALDITPFAEDAIFLKLPLWKTKFSHEERAGISACILMDMMKKPVHEARSIHVEQCGRLVYNETFIFSKYKKPPRRPMAQKGSYNFAFNNCQHFVRRFFYQVSVPRDIKDFFRLPFIARELWLSRSSMNIVSTMEQAIKAEEPSIELLLQHLLKKSAGAAMLDLSNGVTATAEATRSAKESAISLLKETQKVVHAIEKATQAADLAAGLIPSGDDTTGTAFGSEQMTGVGRARPAMTKTALYMENLEKTARATLNELKMLEEIINGVNRSVKEVTLKAAEARMLVEKHLKVMEAAESLGG